MTTIVIKKGIALTWPKATGLSIFPLVGRTVSPFVAGGRQRSCLTQIQLAGPNPILDPTAPLLFFGAAHQLYYAMSGIVKPDAGRSFELPRNPQYVVCFCEKAICFVGCYRPPTGLYHSLSLLHVFVYLFRSWHDIILRGDSAVPFSSLRLRVAHYLPS